MRITLSIVVEYHIDTDDATPTGARLHHVTVYRTNPFKGHDAWPPPPFLAKMRQWSTTEEHALIQHLKHRHETAAFSVPDPSAP